MGWRYFRHVQLLTEYFQNEEWWLPLLAPPIFVEVRGSRKPARIPRKDERRHAIYRRIEKHFLYHSLSYWPGVKNPSHVPILPVFRDIQALCKQCFFMFDKIPSRGKLLAGELGPAEQVGIPRQRSTCFTVF